MGSKTLPVWHLLFIEYLTTVGFLVSAAVKLPLLSITKFVLSLFKACKSPPVFPIGASYIDTSKQLGVKIVVPVQRHCPLMQAPF
jgi:hypothetical protein